MNKYFTVTFYSYDDDSVYQDGGNPFDSEKEARDFYTNYGFIVLTVKPCYDSKMTHKCIKRGKRRNK